MDEIKIEKGIPVPKRSKGIGHLLKAMEVGDSIFLAGGKGSNYSGSFGCLRPKRFSTRAVEGGVRIWRVQ